MLRWIAKWKRAKGMIIPEKMGQKIIPVRGERIMLDIYLSQLYGVKTKALKLAVRRNKKHLPGDFIFELTKEEYNYLEYQIRTLKRGEHAKYLPYASTGQDQMNRLLSAN